FLKGTLPRSLLIDISNVGNQNLFLSELRKFCQQRKNLWDVLNRLRRDCDRRYVEILVSLSMYKLLLSKSLYLKSFETAFPDEILKISPQGLPLQYGRADGGLQQLTHDM
ncbi:MAG: hypothetical protein EXX96DRAFT_492991, partial [Benjaminiella poitrasii]